MREEDLLDLERVDRSASCHLIDSPHILDC
uniref:Uncharacterized protein n=1 Tax=Arundo donax TaxID=35708 RepID=A0A0A9HYW1_ARUDO